MGFLCRANIENNNRGREVHRTICKLVPVLTVLVCAFVHDSARGDVLEKIAWCESRHQQFKANGKVLRGGYSVGIFQIDERFHWRRATALGMDIYTAEGNRAYAQHLLKHYGTWPWKASSRCWQRRK